MYKENAKDIFLLVTFDANKSSEPNVIVGLSIEDR